MKTGDEIFKFIQATLNLFKAVPKFENEHLPQYTLANEKNLENAFFVTVKTFQECPYVSSSRITNYIKDKYGCNIYEMNRNFYRSSQRIANFTPQEVVFDKLRRYLASYGMERLEKSQRDFVYIPNDELGFPDTADQVKIFIVGSISKFEIKNRTLEILHSGAELSEDMMNSLIDIIDYLDIDFEISEVPNKELFVKLCDSLKIVPQNPVQFLRHMIYLGTGSALLIKNAETVEKLKKSQLNFDEYFIHYIGKNGIEKLASIFHRFKPLWLAFKPHSKYLSATINRIRKFADHYHKPLEPKILNHLTSAENVDFNQLKMELSKVTNYKKAALANALLYRLSTPEHIAYNIRNGKTFVKDYSGKVRADTEKILDVVVNSIVENLRTKVRGKRIYIPPNFTYALPVNEKKFIGNIPEGSCYSFKNRSCLFGVHWLNLMKNNDEVRIDLDLHLNGSGVDIDKDADFSQVNSIDTRTEKVVFSGDMTDAPLEKNGATEAFFIGESLKNKIMILNVNHYNRELFRLYKNSKNPPVPFNLILSDVAQDKIDGQYLIDDHENDFCVPFQIETSGLFLGLIVSDNTGKKKFYFSSRNMSEGVVARTAALNKKLTSAMITNFENCLSLNEVLEKAGAILKNVDKYTCHIDLDPSDMLKDTIISLLEK